MKKIIFSAKNGKNDLPFRFYCVKPVKMKKNEKHFYRYVLGFNNFYCINKNFDILHLYSSFWL